MMMTRETKVGLAVASSFIGLVAIVVATKFHSAEPTPPTEVVTPGNVSEVAAKDGKDKKEHKKEAKNPEHKHEARPVDQVAQAEFKVPGSLVDNKDGPPPPVPVPDSPPRSDPAEDRGRFDPALPPGFEKDHKKKKEELNKAMNSGPGPDGPPGLPVPVPVDPGPFAAGDGNPPPPNPGGPPTTPGGPQPAPVTPGQPVPISPMQPPGSAPPPPTPVDPGPGLGGLPPPGATPPSTPGPTPPPSTPGPTPPPFAPSDPGIPPPVAVNPNGPIPPPPGPMGPGTVTPVPKRDHGTPGSGPGPLGANPGPLGAPAGLSIPNDSNAPKVRKFDVQPYEVHPGETSFAAISQKVWSTDRYGQALLLFNRDYPNADKGILQDPPVLRPGQKVHIPTVDYLEQHYASAIGAGNPQPPLGVTQPPLGVTPPPVGGPPPLGIGNVPPISVAPPITAPIVPPVVSTPQPSPPVRPPVASTPPTFQPVFTPTTDSVKSYRVPPQGQHVLEIAQKSLGDRGRWTEIYRLNPTIQPQFLIPGGTELRLPANAVVP